MTDKVFALLLKESKNLAAQNPPDFYNDFYSQYRVCKDFFFTSTLIERCKKDLLPFFNNAPDHGLEHAKKVALDAGTLVLVEERGWDIQHTKRMSKLALMAGLLHDICHHEPDHASRGADVARHLIRTYPLDEEEKNMVAFAIRNHEVFQPEIKRENHSYQIVSNALYDADKFRWGQDNLATALWELCASDPRCLQETLAIFPEAIRTIHSISTTFRTGTGRHYGPQFIRQGLAIGTHIHQCLQTWSTLSGTDIRDLFRQTIFTNPLSPNTL